MDKRFQTFVDLHCSRTFAVSLQHLYEAFQREMGETEVTKEEFLALVRRWDPPHVWNVRPLHKSEAGKLDMVGGYIGGLCLHEERPVLHEAVAKLCLRSNDPVESYKGAMGKEPRDPAFLEAAKDRVRRKHDQEAQFGLLLEAYRRAWKARHGTDLDDKGEKRIRDHYNWYMFRAQAEGPLAYAQQISLMWNDIARIHTLPSQALGPPMAPAPPPV